ncbi:MAG: class I SAM-dependent methyltransferase [Bacilli bacterium]|nr:class I SAM-dependent methyltransferase [Bacilli bacterium]
MEIKLSKRLETIASLVPQSIVADIGSDHGKLMIELFNSGKITKGYAVENKKGPYSRLVKALEEEGIIDNVIPMLSDGITELPKCVNTVVIAGMGGKAIVNILKKDLSKLANVDTLVIDAHSCLPYLREEVSKIGYQIAEERIIKEDEIFYEIIKFVKSGIAFYSDDDYEFGPILRKEKSALFKEKYQSRIDEIDNLISTKKLPYNRVSILMAEKSKLENIL